MVNEEYQDELQQIEARICANYENILEISGYLKEAEESLGNSNDYFRHAASKLSDEIDNAARAKQDIDELIGELEADHVIDLESFLDRTEVKDYENASRGKGLSFKDTAHHQFDESQLVTIVALAENYEKLEDIHEIYSEKQSFERFASVETGNNGNVKISF